MKKILLFLPLIITLFSCSLKYSEVVDAEGDVPEMVFVNTDVIRYENDKVNLKMSAEAIEQYKGSSESYARGVSFSSYDDNEISTEGSCGILYADTSKEIYQLFDDITLINYSDKTKFFADSLRWNKKNEQLVSGTESTVRVEKDDTVITGKGFAASGFRKSFKFSGEISGEIQTK